MIILKKCVCGKTFKTFDYRIRDGRGKFCSKKCQYENATRPSGLNYNIKVVNKGWIKRGQVLPRPKYTLELRKKMRKSANKRWKKGYYINYRGYRVICYLGKEILEHRLVIEKKLGRKLKASEVVHHIDGNILNNCLNNLQLLSKSAHTKLHHYLRKNKCVFSSPV